MEKCTLTEAAHKLGVSLLTLREWLETEGIQPTQDKFDKRRKWLTFEQLALLAESHERILRDAPSYAQLVARIAVLEKELTDLKTTPKRVAPRIDIETTSEDTDVPLLSSVPPLDRPSASFLTHRRRASHDTLPEGFMSASDIERLYDIPQTTLTKARQSGRIAYHQYTGAGKGWKRDRAIIEHAYDEQQVQAFLAVYRPAKTEEAT
jgi:hypothetical protein